VLPGTNPDNMNLQIGCPVAFTKVALQRDAHYMPVKQNPASDSSLAFKYKNQSGKLIQSIEIRVELKVKKSVLPNQFNPELTMPNRPLKD